MHPAGVSTCATRSGSDHSNGMDDLRIMKNGQKSSLHGKSVTRVRIVGDRGYTRAEYHRHDSCKNISTRVHLNDKIATHRWQPKPLLVVATGEACHGRCRRY